MGPTLLEPDQPALECLSNPGPACWARGASSPPPSCGSASTPSASRGPGAIFNSAELPVLKVDRTPGQGSGGGAGERAKQLPSCPHRSPGPGFLRGAGRSQPWRENSIPPHKQDIHGGHTDPHTFRPRPGIQMQTQGHIRVHARGARGPAETSNIHRDSGLQSDTHRPSVHSALPRNLPPGDTCMGTRTRGGPETTSSGAGRTLGSHPQIHVQEGLRVGVLSPLLAPSPGASPIFPQPPGGLSSRSPLHLST